MAKPSIAELRAFLEEKKASNRRMSYNPDIYPFWNMNDGQEATVRILPGEGNDIWPFVELKEHRLAINGRQEVITCPSTVGDPCPICELSREYYSAEGDDSADGKFYYRNRVHLAKALIIDDPLPANPETEETYEGKTTTLRIGYQLMSKIEESISQMDNDEQLPWDLENGLDFIIKVIMNGDRKKYDLGSRFARRASAIPAKYIDGVEIIDLETLIPEIKTYEEIDSMLTEHLSGAGPASTDSIDSRAATQSNTSSGSASRSALDRLNKSVSGGSSDDDSVEDPSDEDDVESSTEDTSTDLKDLIARVKQRNK